MTDPTRQAFLEGYMAGASDALKAQDPQPLTQERIERAYRRWRASQDRRRA